MFIFTAWTLFNLCLRDDDLVMLTLHVAIAGELRVREDGRRLTVDHSDSKTSRGRYNDTRRRY